MLAIRHEGRAQPPIEPTTADNDRLVGAVVRSRCAGTSCTLRPRASVRLEGNGPVSISFAVVFEDTMASTLAHLAATKLTPPQRRRPQAVVDCVEGVGSTIPTR